MSADIPGLVETSTNLAVITTGKKDIAVVDEPAQFGGVGDCRDRRRASGPSSSWAARR